VKRRDVTHCYLCGEPLDGIVDDDHVPPSMFFAKALRKTCNLTRLVTIPVHAHCNRFFRLDEEYFVHTFLPFTRASVSGNALWVDFRRRQKQGRNIPLANAVLKEFKHKIRGVHLPPNVVAKAFDAERVHEVIWKIIRGLHFHHSGEISKANKSSSIVMVRLWLSFFGPLRARECATV
jgi:hypothetical protein